MELQKGLDYMSCTRRGHNHTCQNNDIETDYPATINLADYHFINEASIAFAELDRLWF